MNSKYESKEIDFCNSDAGIIKKGTELYNGGDMANNPHFVVVVKIEHSPAFGSHIWVNPIDSDRKIYSISPSMISKEYKGHGGTRIVTRDAYNDYKNKIMERYATK